MGVEIERKFLVKSDQYKSESFKVQRIIQGYLSSVPERNVRVRLIGDQGFLTVKGIGNESGVSRFEWEVKISQKEAEQLLQICEPGKIDKSRYLINSNNYIIEVDEFLGDNEGLVIAEIELNSEEETFEKPKWLGEEVTGQIRYYNSELMKNPFKNW